MKAFVTSHLSWIFHIRKMEHYINKIHERALIGL